MVERERVYVKAESGVDRERVFVSVVADLVSKYISESSWEVKENANVNRSFTGLVHFVTLESFKRYSLEYVYRFEGRYHRDGYIHIHDLPYSPFVPYCAGWSLEKLLRKGLVTPTVIAKPARHLDSAVDHIVNFLTAAQHEWAGAQAFSNVDLYLAAFVREDGLGGDYRKVKQQVQRLVYNLNFPTRVGSQMPFTNFTFILDTVPKILRERRAVIGGVFREPLESYVDEAINVVKGFIEVYLEGDAIGQPFTFPIPTLIVTRNFDWNERRWGDLSYRIFELAAKRGTFYFLNGVNGVDPTAVFSMCCRLTIDRIRVAKLKSGISLKLKPEIKEHTCITSDHLGGTWAIPDETGSIGVVTINLARLGYLARGDESKLYTLLDELLEVARIHLKNKRERLTKILKSNSINLPITRFYLGTYDNHYNTIGLTAMPEFVANFLQNPKLWFEPSKRDLLEVVGIYKKLLEHIHSRIGEFECEDGMLYNVEETPAEGAGTRLALVDYTMFKREVENGEFFIPGVEDHPYYSNSIVPYYANIPLHRRIEVESEIQKYFTGGVMMHIFLGEEADPEALKKLTYNIICNTRIIYFSYTPAQSICRKCRWRAVGVYWECPKCGSETDVWSRIVGYYRPLKSWNPGRQSDFKHRIHYRV